MHTYYCGHWSAWFSATRKRKVLRRKLRRGGDELEAIILLQYYDNKVFTKLPSDQETKSSADFPPTLYFANATGGWGHLSHDFVAQADGQRAVIDFLETYRMGGLQLGFDQFIERAGEFHVVTFHIELEVEAQAA